MSNNRSLTDRVTALPHYVGTYTTTQTPASGVDVKALKSAEILVYIGAITNIANSPTPSWTFALQHSDTSNANFAAVEAADVVMEGGATLGANGVFATVDAAAEDDAVYRVGYVGAKRYVRVVATAANTPGNTAIAVSVVGEPLLVNN